MPIADFHPKNGPGVTESSITPDGAIQAVAVEVTLTHEAAAELAISLISPTGIEVPLMPVISGSTVRYDLDLPDTETGTWTLRIVDSAKGNRGTLEGWKLLVAPPAGEAAAASAPLAADLFFAGLGDSSDEDETDPLSETLASDLALMLV